MELSVCMVFGGLDMGFSAPPILGLLVDFLSGGV